MSLYRIAEVPDPSGQLADMIEELIDSSALVKANPDYEAAAKAVEDEIGFEMREHLAHILRKWPNTIADIAELAVDAALHIDPPEET